MDPKQNICVTIKFVYFLLVYYVLYLNVDNYVKHSLVSTVLKGIGNSSGPVCDLSQIIYLFTFRHEINVTIGLI